MSYKYNKLKAHWLENSGHNKLYRHSLELLKKENECFSYVAGKEKIEKAEKTYKVTKKIKTKLSSILMLKTAKVPTLHSPYRNSEFVRQYRKYKHLVKLYDMAGYSSHESDIQVFLRAQEKYKFKNIIDKILKREKLIYETRSGSKVARNLFAKLLKIIKANNAKKINSDLAFFKIQLEQSLKRLNGKNLSYDPKSYSIFSLLKEGRFSQLSFMRLKLLTLMSLAHPREFRRKKTMLLIFSSKYATIGRFEKERLLGISSLGNLNGQSIIEFESEGRLNMPVIIDPELYLHYYLLFPKIDQADSLKRWIVESIIMTKKWNNKKVSSHLAPSIKGSIPKTPMKRFMSYSYGFIPVPKGARLKRRRFLDLLSEVKFTPGQDSRTTRLLPICKKLEINRIKVSAEKLNLFNSIHGKLKKVLKRYMVLMRERFKLESKFSTATENLKSARTSKRIEGAIYKKYLNREIRKLRLLRKAKYHVVRARKANELHCFDKDTGENECSIGPRGLHSHLYYLITGKLTNADNERIRRTLKKWRKYKKARELERKIDKSSAKIKKRISGYQTKIRELSQLLQKRKNEWKNAKNNLRGHKMIDDPFRLRRYSK